MDTKTKIPIVGIGRWGKNLLKEFSFQADVTYACHKGSDDSVKFLSENYPNTKATTSLDEMLSDASVEAVIVATPTPTHFEIGLKVLESGKHLFLEKPGTTKSGELEKLCEKAEKSGLVFAVGYEFVHHPALKKIKELMPTNKIQNIRTEWFKWGTFADHAVPHLLSHELSILKTLGAEHIEPGGFRHYKVISDSDIVETEFDCKNFSTSCMINRASIDKRKTVTVLGDGKGYIWNNNELFEINFDIDSISVVEIEKTSAVAEEAKDFLCAISEKREPRTSGRFALDIYKAIEIIGRLDKQP
jgi:predicted dehydrogenase